ncbi:MAG: S8 family serine peptidase, partial [Candidatus Hodarchaeota archaeon]
MFRSRIALLLLLLILKTLFFSLQGTDSSSHEFHTPILAEKELTPLLANWDNKELSETTQAIFLFKTQIPRDLRDIQVLYRFTRHPALLLEGSVEQFRQFIRRERSNIVVVSENQRINTVQPSVLLQALKTDFSSLQIEEIRDIVGATRLHSLGYDGTGIRIGIIDSGINANHPDFEGRVIDEKSFVMKDLGYSVDVSNTEDEYGHGTWVAGVAAGKRYGIAPKAEIINAKIFGNNSVTG